MATVKKLSSSTFPLPSGIEDNFALNGPFAVIVTVMFPYMFGLCTVGLPLDNATLTGLNSLKAPAAPVSGTLKGVVPEVLVA